MIRLVRTLPILAAMLAGASALIGQSTADVPVATQFESLHFRSIGPASMSGRIADLAVYESNPATFWVASAHGGLWKTTNNGATFAAQFQHEGLISLGAVAISQRDPNLVWVGTGEANNRQSTSWGNGVYKSVDGGATFKHMGLAQSFHINRIVVHPADANTVLVAAPGALFGAGGERGVYKTTDAGATWKQVLKVDDDTGANDLVVSPADPKVMYASTYQRRRLACCMNGGGPGSGVWKSTDSGDTWTKLSGNGLPGGSLGRIGLDVFRRSANIVYATIEAEGAVTARGAAPVSNAPGGGDSGIFRSDDGGSTWRKVSASNPRPMYFSQIRIDPNNPDRLLIGGVRLTISLDGGRTQISADPIVHDDKHAMWWNPANSDHVLIGTDGGVYASYDMTRTWSWYPNLPLGTFYHVGYDFDYPFNVCGGLQDNYDWCGPSATRLPRGIPNDAWATVQGGDGFVAIVDPRDSRIVYTESQDGNMSRKNKVTGESKSIRPTAQNVVNAQAGEAAYRFHWDTPILFSPHDSGTLLTAANRVFKSTDRGDSWTALSPDLTTNADRGETVLMGVKEADVRIARRDGVVAWPTIVSLAESPKQPGVYYTGTDDGVVSVSKDAGKTWQNVSANLPGLPKSAFISEVVPSRFDAGTVYVTVDAHRQHDYETHIWVSNDFGATFRSLNANLKREVVKTMTEDQKNADVLYLGTETGMFLTIDRGKSWARLKANFPTVRVDEITLHPRDNALLVATHGRSLWILDHLEPIQEYAAAQAAAAGAHLFSVPPALQWKASDNRNDEFWGHQVFVGENPPTDAVIQFHLKQPVGEPKLRVTDTAGKTVRELAVPAAKNQAGIQTVCWDLRVEPIGAGAAPAAGAGRGGAGRGGAGAGGANTTGIPAEAPPAGYQPANPCGGAGGGRGGGGFGGFGGGSLAGPHVAPATYSVALFVDGKSVDTKPMKVVMDPAVQLTDVQRKRYNEVLMDLHDMQRKGTEMTTALNALYGQMADVTVKVKAANGLSPGVKTQFDAFTKEFDAVRVKFGVPPPAPGAGRGGRGGGAPAPAAPAAATEAPPGGAPETPAPAAATGDQNLVTRAGTLKASIMAIWEMPSDTLMKQYTDVKAALPKALTDANALISKALGVSEALKKANITLTVAMPGK